jgi:2-C-methyl-D-erythritol 4-phosphate cytidylyltransferase
MQKTVIIVAGGLGLRMNSELPKQFLPINDLPLIFHTIRTFHTYDNNLRFLIALHPNYFKLFLSLVEKHTPGIRYELTQGGDTRFQTVKTALQQVTDEEIVAVHDAVRPFVSHPVIRECFSIAEQKGNAIPVVGVIDSLRVADQKGNRPVNRSEMRIVQTPQVFQSKILRAAYQQNYHPSFTDDATVLETLGISINLVEGNSENIKITTPDDLLFAEYRLNQTKKGDIFS